MRKLASIQTVAQIEPIPGADAIERLRVLGWWVVAKKGEFKVGDFVVYIEIDSLLPERPEFEFLRKSSYKPAVPDGVNGYQRAGFRLRTAKLRGQISQGICFPLSILPGGACDVGSDVTEALDIIKYEAPVPAGMTGRVKGGFPGFLSKTDETRVQVLGDVLERYRGLTFAVTEKLDGSSMTAFLRGDEFGICSRNLQLDETDITSVFGRVAATNGLRAKLERMRRMRGADIAIQGEVVGPGVQGNPYKLEALTLYVFNVIDLSTGRWVDRKTARELLDDVNLKSVPEMGHITLGHTIDELVAMAAGDSKLKVGVPREGIVLRPESQVDDPSLGRLSFKVINPAFLLKFDT